MRLTTRTSFPLMVSLMYGQMLQSSHGFAINKNSVLTLTSPNTMKRSSSSLALDPYEQQYQQYFKNLNTNDDAYTTTTTVNVNDSYEQQQQQNYYDTKPTNGFNPQGSYLSQLQQAYAQYPSTESASTATVDPPATSTDSWTSSISSNDPYEMQYRQQFQKHDAVVEPQQQDQTTHHETSAPIPSNEIPTANVPVVENTPEQLVIDQEMEERFLRMVSSEVEYKKLIGQSPFSLTDIDLSIIIQRFLDNIEDKVQKNDGKFKGRSNIRGRETPKEERKTVVVLGTGWGAHAFIELASTYDLRIVVVSPVNHFVFTPMLASAAVGTVEYRSMTEPIRVTNPYIDNYVEGRAIGIDVKDKKLQVMLTSLGTVTGAFKGIAANDKDRLEPEPVLTQIVYGEDGTVQRDAAQGAGTVIDLNYDYLVCAVGTASRSNIVPGAKEYSFNLKTSQDSKRLRTAIGEALEFASRPDVQEYYYPDESQLAAREEARNERRRRVRIAIVGGGPTGVELAGELNDFFAQICRYPDGAFQHLRDDISIMLVHGGKELLPAMDKPLRDRALIALKEQGVELRLNTRLKEVGRDYITIFEKGTNLEETIPVGLSVWAAGNAPVPFVKELLSQLPESAAGSGGRINVDRWLRCPTPTDDSFGSILVLGDVACLETNNKYNPTPIALPQTAQVAGQQGAYAARMLNRGYDMQQTPPKLPEPSPEDGFSILRLWLAARGLEQCPGFSFLSLGLLAYIGQEEALNQVMLGDVPIFNYSGKIAFALWRSVYLAKQASSRNQALIAFDWLRTQTFGRDITRL